jgi:leucyl aminopeptidase
VAVYARKEGFAQTQALERSRLIDIPVATSPPADATAVGLPVVAGDDLPDSLDMSWELLETAGFTGQVGQTYVVLRKGQPATVLVGIGSRDDLDTAKIRDAAAAFANAASTHGRLSVTLGQVPGIDDSSATEAIVEGVLLARYSYEALKTNPSTVGLESFAISVEEERVPSVREGVERGRATSSATILARDLANTPPGLLNAEAMADVAVALGAERGFEVEVFDRAQLTELGCGGLLGVNAGSVNEPRMVKLTYTPTDSDGKEVEPVGRVALVGKGIMYDAGGLAIKPGDLVHATMKNDMSGAAAVLAAVAALADLRGPVAVTGYLMCTDNMPGGSAMAMGDVLVTRGGTSVEVLNTDAEGRLVMADGLVLATEEPHDAIISIATLTGAALRTFGTEIAAILGNHPSLISQLEAAGEATDEPVWELPLARRYRKELDSPIADIANMGGPNAGTITAALFLEEFVGSVPYAHIDIAGTAQTNASSSWRPVGCTGFGARLLTDFLMKFERPS